MKVIGEGEAEGLDDHFPLIVSFLLFLFRFLLLRLLGGGGLFQNISQRDPDGR
jgi:hypothetical protein